MREGIWHSKCGKIGDPEGFQILKIKDILSHFKN